MLQIGIGREQFLGTEDLARALGLPDHLEGQQVGGGHRAQQPQGLAQVFVSLEGFEGEQSARAGHTFMSVIVQIMLIDLVFSLDSIITAVGMVDRIEIMIAAVVVSVVLMMVFAKSIGDFVSNHPSIKMLALSFLVLVGMVLISPRAMFTLRWLFR